MANVRWIIKREASGSDGSHTHTNDIRNSGSERRILDPRHRTPRDLLLQTPEQDEHEKYAATRGLADSSQEESEPKRARLSSSATAASVQSLRSSVGTVGGDRGTTSTTSTPTIVGDDYAGIGVYRGHERNAELTPPSWYTQLSVPNRRDRNASSTDILFSAFKASVSKAKSTMTGNELATVFQDVQQKLHKIVFCDVNAQFIKGKRMLHNRDGLPRIFDEIYSEGVPWPWYIKADAEELYIKWCRGDFMTDIMRGIKFEMSSATTPSSKRKGDRIDPSYSNKVNANFRGNGDLINGQWWPLQLCALRDGAHGVSQGGIYGKEGEGAFSIIVSGENDYPDEDHGTWVLYCGTDSIDGTPSSNTRLMIESATSKKPVRLIRSWKVGGEYAPSQGFRYDGLYEVQSFERLDEPTSVRQRHRFRLERCLGQDPIRGGRGPERRPTEQELQVYHSHQRMSGKKK